MKLTGPIVTLVAGAGLAGALLAVNLYTSSTVDSGAQVSTTRTGAGAATGPTGTASPTDAASPMGATGPTDAATTAPLVRRGNYVGHVRGAGQLALVVRDGVAIGYLCDGESVEAWLQGKATAGTLKLSGRGNASLVGSYDASHVSGTVVVGGVSRQFDIAAVAKPSGLYRATARLRGATVRAGWIVLPDGSQVGVLTTDGSGAQAAPRLDVTSTEATVEGVTLTAVPVDGDTGSGF